MSNLPWHRAVPRTGFRVIADADGARLADCPSYTEGPSLAEAQANAELIATGRATQLATPAPWVAVKCHGSSAWIVTGGPRNVIVAMVRQRCPDAELVALRIAAIGTDRSPE